MQLQPLEDFTIARGLEDHTDSATYYVQAVVRNAKTDALLATVNLTNQGDGHRFTQKWQVPADQTGQGYYLLITTSVYTDSGYTTKSPNYGDKYETYLVQQRTNPVIDVEQIDYRRIQKMIDAKFAQLPAPLDPDTFPKVDLKPVLDAIAAFRRDFNALELPEQEKVDLKPVMARFDTLENAIRAIELPDIDLTQFNGLMAELSSKIESLKAADISETAADLTGLLTRIKQFFGNDMDQMNAKMEALSKQFKKIAYIALQNNDNADD